MTDIASITQRVQEAINRSTEGMGHIEADQAARDERVGLYAEAIAGLEQAAGALARIQEGIETSAGRIRLGGEAFNNAEAIMTGLGSDSPAVNYAINGYHGAGAYTNGGVNSLRANLHHESVDVGRIAAIIAPLIGNLTMPRAFALPGGAATEVRASALRGTEGAEKYINEISGGQAAK